MAVFVESRPYWGGVPGRMIAVLVVVGFPRSLVPSFARVTRGDLGRGLLC